MKGLTAALSILIGSVLFGALAFAAAPARNAAVPANIDHRSGYIHLLLLDQREAMEHVKALHEYADHHGDAMDPIVLCRHVDEIGKNIQGMQEDLTLIEKAQGTSLARWTSRIREDQIAAATSYAALKTQCEEPLPRPERIKSLAYNLWLDLRPMAKQDHRLMMKLAVFEPMAPVR